MKPAIVVTGAASGIGRALALEAAREAGVMVLVDVAQHNLDQVAAEIAASTIETHVLAIDLADRTAGQVIEDALSQRGLYCDVLVNSAGVFLYGPAVEISCAEQLKLFDVNARALAELSLRFLPGMLQRRRGGILNVGSISAYATGPYMGMYFASKAFVKSFSSALAAELAGTGVTVTCLVPGIVKTQFFDRYWTVRDTPMIKLAPRYHPASIAAAGWRGFKMGKSVVIPGAFARLAGFICTVVPEKVLARFVRALQRPRTKIRAG